MSHPRFRLAHKEARLRAMAAVMEAPEGWTVDIKPPGRTLDQSARFHAMINDIVKSGFSFGGEVFDAEDLKVLFVTAWMHETCQPSRVVTGFHGKPVQLRKSTKTFTKAEMGELMTIVERFCAERAIPLKEAA